MRKIVRALPAALLAVSLLCSGALAAGAMDIDISGEIEIDFVARENVFDRSTHGASFYGPDGLEDPLAFLPFFPIIPIPGQGAFSLGDYRNFIDDNHDDREGFVDIEVTLNFDAQLTDGVSAFIQVENEETAGSDRYLRGAPDDFGDDSFNLEVEQAYIQADDFLLDNLSVKLGIQDFAYSLRDDGNYFFLNTSETMNLGSAFQFKDVLLPLDLNGDGMVTPGEGVIVPVATSNEDGIGNEVGGIKATYQCGDALSFDVFWFKALETGPRNNDFDAMGLVADYFMADERSYLTGSLINIRDDSQSTAYNYSDTLRQFPSADLFGGTSLFGASYEPEADNGNWWLLSGGGRYFIDLELPMDLGEGELELYGEVAWEFGDYSETKTPLPNPYVPLAVTPHNAGDLDQNAYAWYVGAELAFKDVMYEPYVGTSFWFFSGDDDPFDGDQANFIKYGYISESLIVEEPNYGLNLDTNYNVWRLVGGLHPNEEVQVEAGYHVFWVSADEFTTDTFPSGSPRMNAEDDFGEELDVRARWQYSENLVFTLGAGLFWPGEYINSNPRLGFNPVEGGEGDDDTAYLVDLDVTLTF